MGELPRGEQEALRGHRHSQIPAGNGEAPAGRRRTGSFTYLYLYKYQSYKYIR